MSVREGSSGSASAAALDSAFSLDHQRTDYSYRSKMLRALPRPHRLDAAHGLRVRHVSAGACHSACVLENGSILTWGANESGQLGHRLASDSPLLRTHSLEAAGASAATAARDSGSSGSEQRYQNVFSSMADYEEDTVGPSKESGAVSSSFPASPASTSATPAPRVLIFSRPHHFRHPDPMPLPRTLEPWWRATLLPQTSIRSHLGVHTATSLHPHARPVSCHHVQVCFVWCGPHSRPH